MSRKRTEINPKRAERVKIICKREKLSQTELSDKLFMTQQNISRMMNLKSPVTEETAQLLHELYPMYRIQWIMGYDDFMTIEDLERDYRTRWTDLNRACQILIDSSVRNVCIEEGIDYSSVKIDIEYLVLEAQLRDFCDGMMWNYLKHRDTTHLFGLLDQVEESIKMKSQK